MVSMSAAHAQPEHVQRIGKRYTLLRHLGAGGMGQVYQAQDRLTGETVALKRVGAQVMQIGDDPVLRLALAREFQALAGLRHPNIISVRDYGFAGAGQPYFTMELLYNPHTLVAAGQFLTPAAKVEMLLPVLHALAYLHRRGIIHRDLKPGNILVSGQSVKVLDFGLAAIAGQTAPPSGTLRYMAPEVLLGAETTIAADLYAVGVMAYELFAGWHPFAPTGQLVSTEMLIHLEPDWSYVDIEPAVIAVLQRLLAKQPQERYPDAMAVIAALSAATGQSLPMETVATRESFLQAAPFVGRETELTQLTAALNKAATGQGSAWLIGGESGVGKSRLLSELRTQALVQGIPVVRSQASSAGGAYHLWRDVVRWLILLTDPTDVEAAVLKPLVPDLDKLLGCAVADAPALEPKAAQTRLLATVAMLLQRSASQQPLLLLLEDLHWADENSLELLQWVNRLVTRPEDNTALLMIATYRRGEAPNLPERLVAMQSLALRRLLPAQIEALSVAMLGASGQQPHLVEFLQQETEGNTFFVVEVLRALAEEAGQLDRVAAMTLPKSIFPGGMQQVVERRLQRIPSVYQPLLQLAAVAGRRLNLPVLQTLLQQAHDTEPMAIMDIEQWLTVCANAAVLERQDDRWHFAHDKLREGILAELEIHQLRQRHRLVAETIEQIFAADLSPYYGDLVYHYRQVEAVAQEQRYARLAGEQAAAQYANTAALTYLRRALVLTPETETAERYALLSACETIYHILGQRTEQSQTLAVLVDLSQRLATDQSQAEVALRQANYAEVTGDFATAVSIAQRAITYARQADARQVETLGYLRWGVSLWRQGQYTTAEAPLRQALQLAQENQLRALEAESLNNLGTLCRYRGDYQPGQRYYEQALALLRAEGNRRGEGVALLNLGVVREQLGDYAAAQSYYEQSLQIRRQIGDRQGMSTCLNNLGVVCDSQGKYSQALNYYEQALPIHQETNNRSGLGYLYNNLAFVFRSLGDYAAAEHYAEEALTLRRAIGDRDGESETLAFLGLINYHQNQPERALTYSQQALQIAQELDVRPSQAYALTCLGHVLGSVDRWREAHAAYQEAVQIRQQLGETNRAMESRAGLARVYLAEGKLEQAQGQTEAILQHLAHQTLDGTEEPFLVYLTCYEVLQTSQSDRAQNLLQSAYEQLQARAAQITDPKLRRSFLENVTVHAQLMQLWLAREGDV